MSLKLTKGYGERIKNAREEKGLSGHELSRLIGLTNVSIYKYEHEQIKPPIKRFRQLAQALDTTPEWLSSGVKNKGGQKLVTVMNYQSPVATKPAHSNIDATLDLCKRTLDDEDLRDLELVMVDFIAGRSKHKVKG